MPPRHPQPASAVAGGGTLMTTSTSTSSIPRVGQRDVDADIEMFYKASDELLKRNRASASAATGRPPTK
ncbi:hypothetical protein EON66_07265 [archaeon]|nr:MAG: hypothetical protein EON66_07265 [archaeon]